MNTIKSISYHGLKNGNAEITFPSRLVAMIGKNRSGKTSVKDALLLAINGSHPNHGKTNKGIMELANGPDLKVQAVLSSGCTFNREWITKKGGSISAEAMIPKDWNETSFTGLDVGAFLAMKGTDRLAFLTGLSDPADLKKVLIAAFPENNSVIETLESADDSHDALATMKKDAMDNRRAIKQEADRLKKALQEHLISERPAEPDTGGQDSNGLKINIRAVQDEIALRNQSVSELRTKAATIETALSNVTSGGGRKKRISELSVIVKRGIEKEVEQEAVLRKQAEKAAGDVTALAQFRNDLSVCQNDILSGDARSFLSDLVAKGEPACPERDIEAVDTCIKKSTTTYSLIRARIQGYEETLDKFDTETIEILGNDCCPVCRSKSADFSAAFKKARSGEKKQIETALNAQLSEIDPLRLSLDAVQAERDLAIKAISEMNEFTKNSAALEADRLACAKSENIQAAMNSLASPLIIEEKEMQNGLIESIAFFHRAVEMLKKLEAESDCEFSQRDLDGVKEGISQKEAAILDFHAKEKDLNAALVALVLIDRFDAEKARLNDEISAAGVETAKAEKAVSAIKAATENLLSLVWQPITEIVDIVLSKTFGKKVSCRVDGLDIGLTDSAGFRPFRSLSGSEKAVVAFGISIAIAAASPLSVVFIDELNRLDSDSRDKFLAACDFLIAKDLIGQIVVLDHNEAGFSKTDFSVIPC